MEVPGFLEEHLEARHRASVPDTVLFPRREGFHRHRTEAHRVGADNDASFDETADARIRGGIGASERDGARGGRRP